MKVIPLYPKSEMNFSEAKIYGKQYLVNKKNANEREEVTGLSYQHNIYNQGSNYLVIYKNNLFRVEGVKACYLHSGDSAKDYMLFLAFGDDDNVYFYSFYKGLEKDGCENRYQEKIVYKELGKMKATNFTYFVRFYKKGLHPSDISNMFKGDTIDNVEEQPVFILRAIAESLKEAEAYFYLEAYKDSENVFSKGDEGEEKVTTFIKLDKNGMLSYDIIGKDFKVLQSYEWNELDIYGDWYESAGWKCYGKDWILSGNELIHITEFVSYNIQSFMDAFTHVKVIPFEVNEEEIFIFFTEAADFSKSLKKGILWNVKENCVYPENIKIEENRYAYEPNLFWHWNRGGIPNVTVVKNGENESFKIWYRKDKHSETEVIEASERPIVFKNEDENSIYFLKTQDYNLMLVMGYDFELKSMYTNVTFFEEINLYKDYPEGLQRDVTESGRYFTKRIQDYNLERHSILIVKREYNGEESFAIFWNNWRETLDLNYSFKSYQFVKALEEEWKKRRVLKIAIDSSQAENSPVICVSDSYKFVENGEK